MQRMREPGMGQPGRRSRRRVRIPDAGDSDLDARLGEHLIELDRRLDRALDAMLATATQLMRRLVAEGEVEVVDDDAGPAAGDVARNLLAHTDERIQTISVRIARIEDVMRQLAEATRDAVRHVNRKAVSIDEEREAVRRARESLVPMLERLESLSRSVEEAHARHREEVGAALESTGKAMGEISQRIQEGFRVLGERAAAGNRRGLERAADTIRGDLQRLEAAVLSQGAFSGQAVADLRAAIGGVAERTGWALEGIRADLASRIEAAADPEEVRKVGERVHSLSADLTQRLGSLAERAADDRTAHHRSMHDLGERTGAVLEGIRADLTARIEGAARPDEIRELSERTGAVLEAVRADLASRIQGAASADEVGAVRERLDSLRVNLMWRLGSLAEQTVDDRSAHDRSLHELAVRTGTALDGIRADLGARIEAAAEEAGGEALRQMAARMEDLRAAVERIDTRERESLASFAERLADRQREDLAAFGDQVRARHIEDLAAFTDRIRAAQREGLIDVAERTEAGGRETMARLDEIEQAHAAQREQLEAFTERVREGLAAVAGRIREGFQEIDARSAEADEALVDRLEGVARAATHGLEEAQAHRERVEAFTERVRRGLMEVTRRIQQGFQLVAEHGAEARQTTLEQMREAMEAGAGGIPERVRDEVAAVLARLGEQQAVHQAGALDAITDSLRSLAHTVRRAGERQTEVVERVLREAASRQESVLDETLSALRTSVQELAATAGGGGNGERAGAAARRLRGVEDRLSRLSQELSTEE